MPPYNQSFIIEMTKGRCDVGTSTDDLFQLSAENIMYILERKTAIQLDRQQCHSNGHVAIATDMLLLLLLLMTMTLLTKSK